jgi:drug/metabolite transporter (DMT)-like permease
LKNLRIPIYLYALVAMFFWGMSFVWSSILLRYYEPVTIIFIRLLLSSFFLFTIILVTKRYQKVQRKDFLLLFMSALFNPFLYFLGENYGLKHSTPAISAVIIATIPVFSPVIAFISFRERLSWFNLAGILLSFAGVLVMLVSPDLTFSADPKGIAFLSGAVLAALLYTVTLKRLSVKYSPLTIISWQNTIGILLFLPIFLTFELKPALAVVPNREIITSFLFLSILASSLSYVFYAKTVKELGISKSNIFSNLIPVFTAIFSYFILDESFTLHKVAGMLVVIAGVYLSEMNRRKGVPASVSP